MYCSSRKSLKVEAADSYPHQPLYISTGILHRLLTEPSSSGERDPLYGSLGLPAACALLVVFLDNSTDFQSARYCFIHPGYALYFGFLMEVGAMFVFNFIIFIWVIRKILCRPLMVSKTAENAKRNEIIKRVRHAMLFWFVLGLSWIFGFFAAVDTKTLIFDYLYCFFISMQGIIMFLLLCVANPAFKEKFKRTDSTQTKVTRQAKTRSLSSSQLGSSSQSNIPMDSMDNPSTSATE
ncbi:putative G-protein coupled receptor [Apostichopus japonicus]|uniref:Putative G-protein coupled receptor n=1 Tax=Stichopus japonicus TaxID=307972 RepID=A0A2G8JK28_STIJA|nr:putative G-protein coupled receptor [Apostichopus japonicus]